VIGYISINSVATWHTISSAVIHNSATIYIYVVVYFNNSMFVLFCVAVEFSFLEENTVEPVVY
jgi:hypothetical protein